MSSTDRILQMVKERNHPTYPLTLDTVALNDLALENNTAYNTRVTMRGKGGLTGYSGQVDLFYTRVSLTAMGTIELVREEQFTFEELLGTVNGIKNAQMTTNDFTNTDLPSIENGVVTTFTLSAQDSSLVWLGNTQVTVLNGIPATAPDLIDFINHHWAPLYPTT